MNLPYYKKQSVKTLLSLSNFQCNEIIIPLETDSIKFFSRNESHCSLIIFVFLFIMAKQQNTQVDIALYNRGEKLYHHSKKLNYLLKL